MKSYFKSLLFTFTFFLLLLSCEKEEHHHHHAEESKITRNVKITNLPGLQNAIQNKEQNNILGRNEINYFDLINYDNITVIEQNDGGKTYTFTLNLVETNQLTNLVVHEKEEVYQYNLITYTSTQIEEWKEKVQNHQPTDIQVTIEVVTIDDETLGSRTTDCYNAGWICPSGQHQDGDQGLCVYDFGQWSYGVYAVPCNSEGGGGGNPGNPNPTPEIPEYEPPFTEPNWPTLSPAIASFIMGLSPSQSTWWNAANPTVKNRIISYLMLNIRNEVINPQALAFALALIDLANNEEDKEIIPNLINLSIVTKENGYFENSFDSNYYNLINPFTEVDTEMYNPLWGVYFTIECSIARHKLSQEPGWNDLHPLVQDAKVYWSASKEMIHLGLDLIGLVPVVGEVADLTNGVIYTIEGDGVNASLSFASTIPVAGWFSAGIKFAKRADGLAYTVKAANNLISFGAYNSKKFRQACGIATGDATQQAHHLIPRGSLIIEHEVVQRAAKATNNGGFHIDQALNGVAVATWRNQPNHPNYNNLIRQKLVNFLNANPNATPTQCYNQLMIILNQAKQAVINNPNTHLNDLIF